MQQGRRSDDGRQCGNAGSRLENQSQELGSRGRKSDKKEVHSEILAHEEEFKAFQKSYIKVGSRSCYERVRCRQSRGRVRVVENGSARKDEN